MVLENGDCSALLAISSGSERVQTGSAVFDFGFVGSAVFSLELQPPEG